LIYYNLPFLLELKTTLDWCFTKTALDLMEWWQIAQFNSEMFLAKVGGKFTYAKKFGEKVDSVEKWICGCIFVGLFLFFLVGPFFIFSNLKSIAEYNLVTDATLDFTLDIKDLSVNEQYQFPLFTSSKPLSMDALTNKHFRN
jgi:hypothetical protein